MRSQLVSDILNNETHQSTGTFQFLHLSFISHADVLIVGGTSLVVYPAAGLIDYYRSDKLVLINRTPTARDSAADLVVTGSIGEIFDSL